METLEAIKNRRSIRKYKADPVDDQTLEILLEAARLAPSWANTQCIKYIVIRDNVTKSRLAETLIPNPSLGTNPATNAIRMAPVVIAVCAEKNVSGCFNGKPFTDKGENWYLFDAGIAAENLVIAATSLGLGSIHVGLVNTQNMAALLGIPDSYHTVELIPIGYPEFQPNPRPRKPLEELIFHEKFGQK